MKRVHSISRFPRLTAHRGMTLIDTLFGAFLMLLVFMGIIAVFQLSVDVVSNNRARAGAIALANERMEYLRSLSYDALGTVGGIPSGSIAQTETISLNSISYTRRVFVVYGDDPRDGEGAEDANGVSADYKVLKVDVSWESRRGTRSVELVSRASPPGVESSVPGGTLSLSIVNAASEGVQNAEVRVVNSSVSPAIDVTTYSDSSGKVLFIGAPAGSGYEITATKSGYSAAQTYSASQQNPNPSPGHLSVSNNQTTSGTFAVDILSSKEVVTRLKSDGTHIAGIPFMLTGAKTIGSSPVIYKYEETFGSGGTGTTTISNLEWDTYTLSISGGSGYNIASSCPEPQPRYLAPGTFQQTILYLAPQSSHSLLVDVRSSATGNIISNASVRAYRTGYDTTVATDACGQSFFSGLSALTYSLDVSATGFQSKTVPSVNVSGATRESVTLD